MRNVSSTSKLPRVGTTIFTEMSAMAQAHGALNMSQGFPDFQPPQPLQQAVVAAMAEGRNQYAPMTGDASLRMDRGGCRTAKRCSLPLQTK